MIILAIKTDSPEVELSLLEDNSTLEKFEWSAGRTLADRILAEIKALLARHDKDWSKLGGLVVYSGPGSFTGLRIGITVANTLADSLDIPIIEGTGGNWSLGGVERLIAGESDGIVMPQYGAEANITRPRK